jgi:hypothetical protein
MNSFYQLYQIFVCVCLFHYIQQWKHKTTRVITLITKQVVALRRSNPRTLGIWFLGSKNNCSPLALSMTQKLHNLNQKWARYALSKGGGQCFEKQICPYNFVIFESTIYILKGNNFPPLKKLFTTFLCTLSTLSHHIFKCKILPFS